MPANGARISLYREIQRSDIVGGSLIVEIVLEAFESAGGHEALLVQFDLAIEVAFALGQCGAGLRRL